ncbi:MAG: enoyl-CoA hydratase/isomerase family protein [Deltaproteobacteria bacterium]|nr:enoyl-CoA hydratase/isomerase family protein [Deltaproteobacteria bacterium]
MDYECIILEKRGNVAVITLNRPDKLNALNLKTKKEVFRALKEIETDEAIRCVIYTGAGKAFSAGFDMGTPPEDLQEFVSLQEEEYLYNFDKPVIAAVHGYTLGDGMQQAMLCDIIVASENAKLGFIGAKIGALCYGSFTVLPAIVGRQKASEWLFTCDYVSAEEAFKAGFVNKVVPHDRLMAAALEMAEKIAKLSPISIKYSKRAMRAPLVSEEHRKALEEGWAAISGR